MHIITLEPSNATICRIGLAKDIDKLDHRILLGNGIAKISSGKIIFKILLVVLHISIFSIQI